MQKYSEFYVYIYEVKEEIVNTKMCINYYIPANSNLLVDNIDSNI